MHGLAGRCWRDVRVARPRVGDDRHRRRALHRQGVEGAGGQQARFARMGSASTWYCFEV